MKKGFSLIELLVVVAIIAVLAAIAVPVYGVYRGRAQIVLVYNIAQSLMQGAVKIFETTGKFPLTIQYKNNTLPSCAWTPTVDTANYIFGFYYCALPSGGNQNSAVLAVSTTGISGIPGYTPQTSQAIVYPISNAGFQVAALEVNGAMRYACGRDGPGNNGYFTPIYLPSTCQCQQIANFFNQTPLYSASNAASQYPNC